MNFSQLSKEGTGFLDRAKAGVGSRPIHQVGGLNMNEQNLNQDTEVVAKIEASKKPGKRVSVRVPIRISTIDPEKDPETGKLYFFTAEEYSANISRSGAFVTTAEPIEPGRRVLVEIDIPNGSSLQITGRVAWKRLAPGASDASAFKRPGIGIEFTGGRPELFNELDRYIAKSARRRPGAQRDRGTASHIVS